MTIEPNRVRKGVREGGQYAATAHNEATVNLDARAWNFDTPEDRARYEEAAAFIAEADIPGKPAPANVQYRPDNGTDQIELDVDDRTLTIRGAGTMEPSVSFDHGEPFGFISEPGDTSGKNEHEVLHDLVNGVRHDAACVDAWRDQYDTWTQGDEAEVTDFSIRFADDGTRIAELDVQWDSRNFEIVQRGEGPLQIFEDGKELDRPEGWLDMLANDFDEDGGHAWGTGADNWRAQFAESIKRAENDPGFQKPAPPAAAAGPAGPAHLANPIMDMDTYHRELQALKDEADDAGFQVVGNGYDRQGEVNCLTDSYFANIAVEPDGTLKRFVSTKEVDAFPSAYRKARKMEVWAEEHKHALARITDAERRRRSTMWPRQARG